MTENGKDGAGRHRRAGDVHTPEQRSYNMSRIRGRDTKPEKMIRKAVFSKGYRYRIGHGLPGKPDMVFVSKRLAVFIDGCFWHRCPRHFRLPATNTAFWDKKIRRNVERDHDVTGRLSAEGWRVLRFWEHQVKADPDEVVAMIEKNLLCKSRSEKDF